jgi:hypothetical protein
MNKESKQEQNRRAYAKNCRPKRRKSAAGEPKEPVQFQILKPRDWVESKEDEAEVRRILNP